MAAAEAFIAKPKLARLKSWLSMRRRVPSPPQAPDREKVRSTPNLFEQGDQKGKGHLDRNFKRPVVNT